MNELSAKFGPGYPKLAELQSSLDSTQKSIRDEAARVQARVLNDYTVAQQIEDKDRAVFLDEKSQAESQNDKAVQYQIARQEATQSRTLYENLVARMKEADVVAGMRSSNITLVDAARVPARPAKPSVLIYAAGFDCRRTSFWNMRSPVPRRYGHPHPGAWRNGAALRGSLDRLASLP